MRAVLLAQSTSSTCPYGRSGGRLPQLIGGLPRRGTQGGVGAFGELQILVMPAALHAHLLEVAGGHKQNRHPGPVDSPGLGADDQSVELNQGLLNGIPLA